MLQNLTFRLSRGWEEEAAKRATLPFEGRCPGAKCSPIGTPFERDWHAHNSQNKMARR